MSGGVILIIIKAETNSQKEREEVSKVQHQFFQSYLETCFNRECTSMSTCLNRSFSQIKNFQSTRPDESFSRSKSFFDILSSALN